LYKYTQALLLCISNFYSYFAFFEDKGKKWMVVVVCENRKIIFKNKKTWYFNEIWSKIKNLMLMFWKLV